MIRTFFGLLVAALDLGKVQGGLDDALVAMLALAAKVAKEVPGGASELVDRIAKELAAFLGEHAAKFDLKAIAQEIIAYNGRLLGRPDPDAGLGL